jgi:hypothetical protein
MKPEEPMKPFGGRGHNGPIATRPGLRAPRINFRICGGVSGANYRRWVEHQKKLAIAIVRLCTQERKNKSRLIQ